MANHGRSTVDHAEPDQGLTGQASVEDAVIPGVRRSGEWRWPTLLLTAGTGVVAAQLAPMAFGGPHIVALLCVLAVAGGLLSTWSPCGYSSLSLLRVDPPYNTASVGRWLPTMAAHAFGYVIGGLVLAAVLAAAGWLLPSAGFAPWEVAVLGGVCLLYGLHQLQIMKMPYPQLRAQVSHGARMTLPKSATGFLYGAHLGLNFATYVRSPILYVVALAAVLGGSFATAVLLVFSLNLGRFLPLLVNLLPVPDWSVQRWMAAHNGSAVLTDAGVLVLCGSLLLASGTAFVF